MRRSLRRRLFDFYILRHKPCGRAKAWLREHPTLSPEECITNCGQGSWIIFVCRTHAIKMVRILTKDEKKLIADYNRASKELSRLRRTRSFRKISVELSMKESDLYSRVWNLAYGLPKRDASSAYRDMGSGKS